METKKEFKHDNKLRICIFDIENGECLVDKRCSCVIGGIVEENGEMQTASCFAAVRCDGQGVVAGASAAKKAGKEICRRAKLTLNSCLFDIKEFFKKMFFGGNIDEA